MTVKCPFCKRDVKLDETKLKYHKRGRVANRPECKRAIVLSRFVREAR